MNKTDYYEFYQANLKLLECEMDQTKKTAQALIGKKYWQKNRGYCQSMLDATDREIQAATRLYTFLLCSWFEARLNKILYENSSAAFSKKKIKQLKSTMRNGSMNQAWRNCFIFAFCKGYGFKYDKKKTFSDYSSMLSSGSLAQQNFNNIVSLFDDIDEAITIRNRLAHGQWAFQLNADENKIHSYDFLTKYDNMQKLDILQQCYTKIAEIINMYVTYKDRNVVRTKSNFDQEIQKRIKIVYDKKASIAKKNYESYEQMLGKKHENLRKRLT